MSIKVKFFASLAETLGRREAAVDFHHDLSVEGLWMKLTGQDGIPSGVLCAVNMEYCEHGQTLCDGDEVAYFPPVTGGGHAD